jgi:hypothetical protein
LRRTLLVLCVIFGILLVLVALSAYAKQRQNKNVMARFAMLLAKEDVTVAEVTKYIDENIAAVSKENATKLVFELERLHQTALAQWQRRYDDMELQEKIAGVYRSGWTRADINRLEDASLKSLLLATLDNGFKIETAEGSFFPVIDYGYYQKYQSAVTADCVAYLEIMRLESERMPAKDAALMIGWEEILARAERQEQFIKAYSSSPYLPAVQLLLQKYVSFALFGTNNTPLFSYETKRIRPEAQQVFQEFTWAEENGTLAQLIKEYLAVLAKNNYCLTGEVDRFRKQAIAAF